MYHQFWFITLPRKGNAVNEIRQVFIEKQNQVTCKQVAKFPLITLNPLKQTVYIQILCKKTFLFSHVFGTLVFSSKIAEKVMPRETDCIVDNFVIVCLPWLVFVHLFNFLLQSWHRKAYMVLTESLVGIATIMMIPISIPASFVLVAAHFSITFVFPAWMVRLQELKKYANISLHNLRLIIRLRKKMNFIQSH